MPFFLSILVFDFPPCMHDQPRVRIKRHPDQTSATSAWKDPRDVLRCKSAILRKQN